MKICKKCNLEKSIKDFHKLKAAKDGLHSYCKLCHNLDARKSQDNALKTKKGHIARILNGRKRAAISKGIAFEIDAEYAESIFVTNCPVLGVELNWCVRTQKPVFNSPSLDRFIPELGYIKGNVAWVSHKANALKSDGTIDQFKSLVKWMETNG